MRDKGERPVRLRRLMGEAEAALAGIEAELGGWRIDTLRFVRSRLLPPWPGSADEWAGVLEYRARLLAVP